MKKIKNLINNIVRKFRYKKLIKNSESINNVAYVDLGASSIKMSYNNKYVTFRSSVRKVLDTNEITVQKNVICVNGTWYIVGESTQPTGNYLYKYQKEHLEVLIMFGLTLLEVKESSRTTI